MIKRSAKYVCAVTAVVGLVIATHGNEIRTSEKGLLLIGNAEGCMQKPYQCPADVLTVGIGTTDAVERIDRNKPCKKWRNYTRKALNKPKSA